MSPEAKQKMSQMMKDRWKSGWRPAQPADPPPTQSPATPTAEATGTSMSIKEVANRLKRERHSDNVFVLHANGVGSKVVGLGATYEEMWKSAKAQNNIEFRSKDYLFDHIPLERAMQLIEQHGVWAWKKNEEKHDEDREPYS